ncbi:hypothetical protein G3570_05735 [Balneolaceae bacterium YR4-1]|uniref:Uncharacterized protein n=1 Tax=Halalkalibaculum roseum TaxID=2709311 RepID=A0A6M1STI9_9BACT|nr:hypothetical protein [Halalkalibaculum roseum]NGP76122.1 hypothetical protein [Halalkalibaculum roseum]
MSFTSFLSSLFRSLLAFFLGGLAFILIVMPYGIILDSVFPGSMGSDMIPETLSSQVLLIVINFIGGSIATLVVSLMAPKRINVHAFLFGVFLLFLNLSTLFGSSVSWPLWISIVLLVALPFEIWTGAWLGNYIRVSDQQKSAV